MPPDLSLCCPGKGCRQELQLQYPLFQLLFSYSSTALSASSVPILFNADATLTQTYLS